MNSLMGVDFKNLTLIDADVLVDSIGSLNCSIYIGSGGLDRLETRLVWISSRAEDLRRIAIMLLACAIGTRNEAYLPNCTENLPNGIAARPSNSMSKGIRITAARPADKQPKSFTYISKRKIKRYP